MMNVKQAAEQVLKEARKPLHVNEITKRIMGKGLWESKGKTPIQTVRARIQEDINKLADESVFEQTAPATFTVRAQTTLEAKEPKIAKSKYSFLDAAEKVLDQFGNRNAMHYGDITEKAIELEWIVSQGKTPKATMNAQLATDFKRSRIRGELGRFSRPVPGYYGLVKWTSTGLSREISEHNNKTKEKLLSQLREMPPLQFEGLVGDLLVELGFESIEITSGGNDGGVDVRGTLLIGDAVRIKMAVQVKRWAKSIQRPDVQRVRGSLSPHEQGLIITTGKFSKGAINDAELKDRVPVALMNGEQLASLLMSYDMGVERKPGTLFELVGFPN